VCNGAQKNCRLRIRTTPDLISSEDPENMDFGIRGEAEALGAGRDDPGHEGPVAELVVQGLFVRPVRSLADLSEVRMVFGQP